MRGLKKKRVLLSFIVLIPFLISGQNVHQLPLPGVNDSLTIQQILQQVTTTYPTVLKAQEAINSADAAIGLAKSGYYPNISGQAGYTRLGPASKLSIPMLGSFELYPQNNYNF